VFLTAVSKIPSVRNRYRFPSCRARVFDARREGCRSSPPPPHESAAYLAVTATQLPDERLLSACPILHVFYARHMNAVRTAIDGVGRLNAMAEDGAPAVSASGRQGVNGALETVEDVMDRIWRLDRKSPVVVVSACFANGHCSTSVRVDRERAAVGPGQEPLPPTIAAIVFSCGRPHGRHPVRCFVRPLRELRVGLRLLAPALARLHLLGTLVALSVFHGARPPTFANEEEGDSSQAEVSARPPRHSRRVDRTRRRKPWSRRSPAPESREPSFSSGDSSPQGLETDAQRGAKSRSDVLRLALGRSRLNAAIAGRFRERKKVRPPRQAKSKGDRGSAKAGGGRVEASNFAAVRAPGR
jgi:hypothetical protein